MYFLTEDAQLEKPTPDGILISCGDEFDPAQTLDCGQCFRFNRLDNGSWHGVAGSRPLTLSSVDGGVLLHGIGAEEYQEFWRDYFDIGRNYAAIRTAYRQHPVLSMCAEYAPGIRILRQDAWEALISFIISQNNNIKRIKGIVERLCMLAGNETGPCPGAVCPEEKVKHYAFPCPAALAELNAEALAPLRAGWRTEYILDAAKKVAGGELNLEEVAKMPIDDARTALRTVKGVGSKVAECVLLYGMGRTEAFPMDVWMKRAMAELFSGQSADDFGRHPGIAQQYIFHYMRTRSI